MCNDSIGEVPEIANFLAQNFNIIPSISLHAHAASFNVCGSRNISTMFRPAIAQYNMNFLALVIMVHIRFILSLSHREGSELANMGMSGIQLTPALTGTGSACPSHNFVTCNGQGSCRDGQCVCEQGYIGATCNIDANAFFFFNMNCENLDDTYTSAAIRTTTIGSCQQYRLIWTVLAYRTCKAMKGQSCEINERREYCERIPGCPELCRKFFDISCGNINANEMLNRSKNVTFNNRLKHVVFSHGIVDRKKSYWHGEKIGLAGSRNKKNGWSPASKKVLHVKFNDKN